MKFKSVFALMIGLLLASILIPAFAIQPVRTESETCTVDDEQADFSKPRKLKILVYALHHAYSSAYIGGAWVRLIEFLRRAKTANVDYVLIEPSPKFKDTYKLDYESIAMHPPDYNRILGTVFGILEATMKGILRAIERDIDLVISPIETPHCIISAFMTSLITGIPWTLVAHDVPVYAGLMEKQQNPENHSPSLKDLYQSIRYHKHKDRRIQYVLFSTMLNYITYKILRTTVIIGIGSTVRYLNLIDNRIQVKKVFPANSIPLGAIADTKEKRPNETKEYDALFVGSLLPERGILDAIRAWSLVTKKNPSLKLVLIGKAKDGRMVKLIENLIERNNLKENIRFLCNPLQGAPAEIVYESMKKSRILIFPSTIDTWSITVGEALAFGLPVVGYDILALKCAYAGCGAIIRVPIGDTSQLAAETIKLLENPRQMTILSKEATQYMENYFTWNQVISAERSLYEELCEGTHARVSRARKSS